MMDQNVRAWAQLVRVPNTLTACADPIAGFTIVVGAWHSNRELIPCVVLIALASICFYWAGMVLNDVNDIETDRANRRRGPLVDGRISIVAATRAVQGLFIVGLMFVWLSRKLVPAEWVANGTLMNGWLAVPVALTLIAAVVAYDSRLKATWTGPWLMGLCRGMNMLLGVALGAAIDWPNSLTWGCVAIAVTGHMLFVVGITLAARRESSVGQSHIQLAKAWVVGLFGGMLIAGCSMLHGDRMVRLEPWTIYPLLVGLVMVPWLRRAIVSVHRPGIMTLVPAIKQAILTILFFDAAMALQFGGNTPGILICAFALPTLALARVFRMT
jgi:4-hydroxybenzoate polyprenyltransferase